MQANGGTSEVITAGGGVSGHGTIGNGNDNLPDNGSQAVQQQQTNQNQQQQPQQQIKPSTSPAGGQQHLQHPVQNMHSVGQNHHHQMGFSGDHHHQHHHHSLQQQSGSYYQRHPQPPYHNQHQQHQQMQHYHHQQQQHLNSKYNNNLSRGGGGGVGGGGGQGGDNESNVNHVLLITVINPHYTITCDLIHQICSTYGKVNRIVIFKKNGVQAMVEFDNVESAKRAKSMLYGCDIYSGCCTLRIEYAKPTRLNIHKNDNDSFDYTNPNLGSGGQSSETAVVGMDEHSSGGHHGPTTRGGGGGGGRSGNGSNNAGMQHFHPTQHHHSQPGATPHVQQQTGPGQHGGRSNYGIGNPLDPSSAATDTFHHDGGFNVSRASGNNSNIAYQGGDSYLTGHPVQHGGGGHHQHGASLYSRHDGHQHHQPSHHHRSNMNSSVVGGTHNHSSSFSSANTTGALMVGPSNLAMQPQGTVMMVYGLQPERVNCDRLFNLFCLYGNVVRVKFLRTKEGCAMVQMGDVLAVDRCVSSLNKITLFNSELQISYSKQAFLHDVIQPFFLPDMSPSFKDFMGNKNNRFKNPEVASKNRILPPSQVLHFFNAPYGITEDEMVHLFKTTANHEPVSIKMFTPKTDNSKSFSGLVTFKDASDATEVLVLCNHASMQKAGAPHPYILRLCFSPPTYMRPPPPIGDASAHR